MKIVVLTGSPRRKGTSCLLAEEFMRGAEEGGHQIFRFDAAFEQVHPCTGCDRCQCGSAPCIFDDGMARLSPKLIEADLVVFVTPLYYHGASAQLKTVVDRFHGIDDLLRGTGKKAMLLVTAADCNDHIMRGVTASFEESVRYLGWQDCGRLLAMGCYSREDIEKTDFPRRAYELGRSL